MSHEIFTAETFVGNISKSKACSLLEIACTFTGWPFSQNTQIRGFAQHSRYIYAPDVQEHPSIQQTEFPDVHELISRVKTSTATFDIAYLDPWHKVEDSLQILEVAISTLRAGATLIMHDCHPQDAELRSTSAPEIFPQAWCGSTWVAWSLFTRSLSDEFSWMTIDADYGLGVLKIPESKSQRRQLLRLVRSLSKKWASGNLPRPEWSGSSEHLHLVAPNDPRVTAWV
jgi:hypothetical protein